MRKEQYYQRIMTATDAPWEEPGADTPLNSSDRDIVNTLLITHHIDHNNSYSTTNAFLTESVSKNEANTSPQLTFALTMQFNGLLSSGVFSVAREEDAIGQLKLRFSSLTTLMKSRTWELHNKNFKYRFISQSYNEKDHKMLRYTQTVLRFPARLMITKHLQIPN